jgi:hypothetical protein
MSKNVYCNYTMTEAYKNNKLTQNTKKDDWGSYQIFLLFNFLRMAPG